jgi:hypothetical protein
MELEAAAGPAPGATQVSAAPSTSTTNAGAGDMSLASYLLPELSKQGPLLLGLVKPVLLWLRSSASSSISSCWLLQASMVSTALRKTLIPLIPSYCWFSVGTILAGDAGKCCVSPVAGYIEGLLIVGAHAHGFH